ncbi:hypothetical protein HK096_007389, partial [Nowakowskiella sp. JEL0078]
LSGNSGKIISSMWNNRISGIYVFTISESKNEVPWDIAFLNVLSDKNRECLNSNIDLKQCINGN